LGRQRLPLQEIRGAHYFASAGDVCCASLEQAVFEVVMRPEAKFPETFPEHSGEEEEMNGRK
jgi:hypothetical protein